jgi:hypothetical protein
MIAGSGIAGSGFGMGGLCAKAKDGKTAKAAAIVCIRIRHLQWPRWHMPERRK